MNRAAPPAPTKPSTARPSLLGGSDSRATGLILLALISVLWGVNWPAMKIVLNDMSVWTYRSLCILFGGFGLLAIARIGRQRIAFARAELLPLLICATFNITGWHIFTGFGLQHLEAGRASIIAFTMPLWATLAAIPILRDRLTWRRTAGLGLGMAGLAVLMGVELASAGRNLTGALFMLAGAISWGIGTAAMKLWRFSLPTAPLTGWLLLLGGIPIYVATLAIDGVPRQWFDLDGEGLFALAYTLVVAMIICHWSWFKIVTIFPAAVAAIGTLAIPVFGVLSSALWTGEAVGGREIAALALVLSGVATVLLGPPARPDGAEAAAEGSRR